MTEFAFNAAVSLFIKLFAFIINYEYKLRMSFDFVDIETTDRLSTKERILTEKARTITEKMRNIWDFIKKKLANAQNMQKRYANQKRNLSSEYQIEDMMWLFIKNIKTKRSFKKHDHKWIESYKILKVLRDAYQLNLSLSMKIHNMSRDVTTYKTKDCGSRELMIERSQR